MAATVRYALTVEQIEALKTYAAENGRAWKSSLSVDWMNGKCTGELQRIRNAFGPRWLKRFKFAGRRGN